MARVILGVGAGIAAYKACELLRLLKEAGHHVRVVPTPDALRFAALSTLPNGQLTSVAMYFDDLTGLPNRSLVEQSCAGLIAAGA